MLELGAGPVGAVGVVVGDDAAVLGVDGEDAGVEGEDGAVGLVDVAGLLPPPHAARTIAATMPAARVLSNLLILISAPEHVANAAAVPASAKAESPDWQVGTLESDGWIYKG